MRFRGVCALALWFLLTAGSLVAQSPPAAREPGAAPAADQLGRGTPRGTVLGFLSAARRGEYALASQYLDTQLDGKAAERLSLQLFIVLDARLPARLTQISDEPEGSRANLLEPDRELVGRVPAAAGSIEIYVDRLQRAGAAPIWLFSSGTLASIPSLYQEVTAAQRAIALPRFLTTRIAGLRVLDWIVVLVGLPIFFVVTALLNRLLVPLLQPVYRRVGGQNPGEHHNVLPVPVRLLLLALAARWILSGLPLSLIVRQFWSNAISVIAILSVVWLLILANGEVERLIRCRMSGAGAGAATSLLRVLRRIIDVLFAFGGFLALLLHFDVNPTPALAGLGVGGIAVALAAQKTLENVIAGASLIFDQAVRVGDFLRIGTMEGTVDHIGLRSTRIRTLDRTIVSVPNGQIANVSLEALSSRDKFWFHPDVRLRYETTAHQLRAVLDGIRRLLSAHSSVDEASIRVRFVRLGPFSFDIEVFAYVFANDWSHFLEIQEGLLFGVAGVVERAGTGLAFPAQTMYLTDSMVPQPSRPSLTAGVG